ncbi:NAD-binding protein [Candidatus Obscuribacterales bacterium]|nr:NAD-binding protein [Candidatus Obscuribacterales bacterium]
MKFLTSQILSLVRDRSSRVKLRILIRFLIVLVILVTVYSVMFHFIMEYEGRRYSWITCIYWTLTVMSTLGFGDITFHSDLGKVFSLIVLMSGIVFLLILLPFTFIEFFYAPWMKAHNEARAPTSLPEGTTGHVIITNFDGVTRTLIGKLKQYSQPYVLLVPDLTEALNLHDQGYRVMLADLDTPKSYQRALADDALMVVATASDQLNANIASTVREIPDNVPIVATANAPASLDILELAGCTQVLELCEMMGRGLARRVFDGKRLAHPIGRFGELVIAEAMVRDTSLVGKTLRESCLRKDTGLNVLGSWQRGFFETVSPDMLITDKTILVVAGSEQQLDSYNRLYQSEQAMDAPIVVIGGGRVGRATTRALADRGLDYCIVEKRPELIKDPAKYVLGDGANFDVLDQAGIMKAPVVIITTSDDDMNIYLTIYCRQLRPDVEILCRSNLERNVATLHRVGADFVLSYASIGANTMINLLGRMNILMMTEGLDIFQVDMPPKFIGKSVTECDIQRKTGCTVVALHMEDQKQVMLDPNLPLPKDGRLILIGSPEAEQRFLTTYGCR